jgi:hypothetical protein
VQVPPEMNRGAAGHDTPKFKTSLHADDIAQNSESGQAPSALDLQIFCLARRFSLNASVAEAFAVLVYGGLHK